MVDSELGSGWLAQVKAQGVIAVIRSPDLLTGTQMARSVAAGGIHWLEVTWSSHQPAALLHHLRTQLPHCQIGAGTLLTGAELQAAIAAGAQFLFTPHVDLKLIELARQQQIPMIPGALSPTEIVAAWQAGASSVKVFPVQSMGGASYIRHLQPPLGHIPLIPTGGVTLENASSFLEAGAIAVGLAGQLFPAEAIAQSNWAEIQRRADRLMKTLQAVAKP